MPEPYYTEVTATAPDGTVTHGVGWSGDNPPPVDHRHPDGMTLLEQAECCGVIQVSAEEVKFLTDLIENPPPPTEKLIALMRNTTGPVFWNPKRWGRVLRRKKRMALRRRRGRGACSS